MAELVDGTGGAAVTWLAEAGRGDRRVGGRRFTDVTGVLTLDGVPLDLLDLSLTGAKVGLARGTPALTVGSRVPFALAATRPLLAAVLGDLVLSGQARVAWRGVDRLGISFAWMPAADRLRLGRLLTG